jgi:hypothetical protein
MPVLGYIGARTFRSGFISLYFFYLLMQIILRVFVLALGEKFLVKHHLMPGEVFYLVLLVFVNVWIMSLVVRFVGVLKTCAPDELLLLRSRTRRGEAWSGQPPTVILVHTDN